MATPAQAVHAQPDPVADYLLDLAVGCPPVPAVAYQPAQAEVFPLVPAVAYQPAPAEVVPLAPVVAYLLAQAAVSLPVLAADYQPARVVDSQQAPAILGAECKCRRVTDSA